MGRGLLSIIWFGLIAIVAAQELDPIVNFCRRIDHQSVVVNGTLYIDGGSATFINVNSTTGEQYGNITDGINKYLITVDMSSSWDWKTNISVKAITKGNSTSPDIPTPMLVRGGLYAGPLNDTKVYSYGGSDTYENVSFPGWVGPTSDQYPLWSYEYESAAWKSYDLSNSGVIRPSSGAVAEARELGLGFWYNGQVDSGSSTETQPLGNIIQFIKGLVVVDFNTGLARNLSTDAVSDQPRVRSKMVYVPGIGQKGVLVLIGGGEKGYLYENSDRYGTAVAMDQIYLFDVASLYDESKPNGTWYQQKATGSIPKPRLDHCIVLVSSQDGSSHNIYMYGGRDGSNTYFDDVYVLSLPSFTWINIYTGQSPRYAMTCHLVGNRQMITAGGGTQAAINKDCDWELKGVAIYDLSTLLWGSVYTHDAAPYEVPKLIRDVIGGTSTGNATLTKPSGGFSDPNLENLFFPGSNPNGNSTSTNGTSSSTTSSAASGSSTGSSSKSHTGAIAGGVVGGILGLALIGLGAFLFRRRQQAKNAAVEAGGHNVVEKDGSTVKPNNEMLADTQYTAPPQELPGGVLYEPQELSPANYTREQK